MQRQSGWTTVGPLANDPATPVRHYPHGPPIRQTVMLTAPAAAPSHLACTGLPQKTVFLAPS
ncbi:hypothetical protein LMG27177_03804 [Paraburkholderia fynbosensis]|uniref:Uncharacterized protein n=1 Tax=Paraburkholderia fynbosensis TaxID=1200993 RepID=A0A6J5GE43_9BURK|nr:hypothetical protein LMG27177_03804 [Paraburkholderia fynbosensis]